MKSLSEHIRINRFRLREKQRERATLESLHAQLQKNLQQLPDDFGGSAMHVGESCTRDGSEGPSLPSDFERRRAKLMESLREADQEIERAGLEVDRVRQELRRFEVARTTRARMVAERSRRLRESNLDEISLSIYRRAPKQSESD